MALWRGKNLYDMFNMMIKEDDNQLEMQVRGWAAMGEVYQEQWSNLLEIKQAMEESWTSEGGQAYLTRLNEVTTSLQTAQTEASGNARALDSVRSWIAASQSTLEGLIIKFEQEELTAAWDKYWDDLKTYEDKSTDLVPDFLDSRSKPTEVKPEDVLESSGYNDKGKAVMDLVATEINKIRTQQLEYPSSYQGPTNSILAANITPPTPNVGNPGSPGSPEMPAAPSAPNIPAMPASPTVPAGPQQPQAPNVPAVPGVPGAPGMPGAPAAPGMPGAPRAPGAPAVPGAPGMAGARGRPGLSPLAASRPAGTPGGAPGVTPPTAPGKPGAAGKMAPPMGGMGPKGNKKGVKPGGPGRPGTPMGSPGAPGKPGMSGKMAPPAGGVPPRNSKKTPERKPGQPMHPASSGHPGKPAKGGKGGKPLAGRSGAARGGGQPGGGQFQAPPHIGRPTGKNKTKDQSGYGKFGTPEGSPLGGAPRVTKPGGSRPVLNNRAASPTQTPGARDLGVPASQRPRAKTPGPRPDSRGVITSGKGSSGRPIPKVSREAHEQGLELRRKHPETADYLNHLFKVAGLRPAVIEPPAPPKAHTVGPVIGA